MKAFLLAAGKGTRLKPYTDQHPKCLIPIHGTPLLKIWVDLLEKHGVSEILINTHHHADQVMQFVAQTQPETSVALHTVYEPVLLGSAGTLWENRNFVKNQSDFIIAYADNLTNLNMSKMIDNHRQFRSMGGILTMGLIKAPDPRLCGIVTLDHDRKIIRFVEKPDQPVGDLANGGIYISSKRIYNLMESGVSEQHSVWDLGYDVFPLLAGKMYGFPIAPFYLKDIGTPEAYQTALRQWLEVNDLPPDETPAWPPENGKTKPGRLRIR
jgi:mannose-1-phosphate guanylyltransferase